MAKKKNGDSLNPLVRLGFLCILIGVPVLFFLLSRFTSAVAEKIPIAFLVLLVVVDCIYTFYTARLLYSYYGSKVPILSAVPCFGELYIMDSKYTSIGRWLYLIAVALGIVIIVPMFGFVTFTSVFMLTLPTKLFYVLLVDLIVIQVVKGLGILDCEKTIASDALNKPLSTLVDFNGVTSDSTDDVVLSEEE